MFVLPLVSYSRKAHFCPQEEAAPSEKEAVSIASLALALLYSVRSTERESVETGILLESDLPVSEGVSIPNVSNELLVSSMASQIIRNSSKVCGSGSIGLPMRPSFSKVHNRNGARIPKKAKTRPLYRRILSSADMSSSYMLVSNSIVGPVSGMSEPIRYPKSYRARLGILDEYDVEDVYRDYGGIRPLVDESKVVVVGKKEEDNQKNSWQPEFSQSLSVRDLNGAFRCILTTKFLSIVSRLILLISFILLTEAGERVQVEDVGASDKASNCSGGSYSSTITKGCTSSTAGGSRGIGGAKIEPQFCSVCVIAMTMFKGQSFGEILDEAGQPSPKHVDRGLKSLDSGQCLNDRTLADFDIWDLVLLDPKMYTPGLVNPLDIALLQDLQETNLPVSALSSDSDRTTVQFEQVRNKQRIDFLRLTIFGVSVSMIWVFPCHSSTRPQRDLLRFYKVSIGRRGRGLRYSSRSTMHLTESGVSMPTLDISESPPGLPEDSCSLSSRPSMLVSAKGVEALDSSLETLFSNASVRAAWSPALANSSLNFFSSRVSRAIVIVRRCLMCNRFLPGDLFRKQLNLTACFFSPTLTCNFLNMKQKLFVQPIQDNVTVILQSQTFDDRQQNLGLVELVIMLRKSHEVNVELDEILDTNSGYSWDSSGVVPSSVVLQSGAVAIVENIDSRTPLHRTTTRIVLHDYSDRSDDLRQLWLRTRKEVGHMIGER
ncbi:hypothetical protein KCV03_g149, partial [Aureobasidium melanogenum]